MNQTQRPNTLADLRNQISRIENTTPLTWLDIEIESSTEVIFTFNGKLWEVDPKFILDVMGGTVTRDYISGGYDYPEYTEYQHEITIDEIDRDELRKWLFNNQNRWVELPE